jgi:hypothetical protein
MPTRWRDVLTLQPTMKMVTQKANKDEHRRKLRAVTHRQFPITPAYTFIDYRSQDQMISGRLLTLAKPPTGILSLFNHGFDADLGKTNAWNGLIK